MLASSAVIPAVRPMSLSVQNLEVTAPDRAPLITASSVSFEPGVAAL